LILAAPPGFGPGPLRL